MLNDDCKTIHDPVHGPIVFHFNKLFDKIAWELIQTSEMQRLRFIRQTGLLSVVYPNLVHDRFSHCVGTSFMAKKMLNVLESSPEFMEQNKDFEFWKTATICAALLHDIGHGPLSHLFEDLSKRLNIDTSHEVWTKRMIEFGEPSKILDSFDKDFDNAPMPLKQAVLSFFTDQADSMIYHRIVSSELDADRLDYLARDNYFAGIKKISEDITRIVKNIIENLEVHKLDSGIYKGEFVFTIGIKNIHIAESYLMAYKDAYYEIYHNKTCISVDVMFLELFHCLYNSEQQNFMKLHKSDKLMKYFTEKGDHISTYMPLTDIVIWDTIDYVASKEDEFGELSELAKRIINRKLYKAVTIEPRIDDSLYNILDFLKGQLESQKIWYKIVEISMKCPKVSHTINDVKGIFTYENDTVVPYIKYSTIAQDMEKTNYNYMTIIFKNDKDRCTFHKLAREHLHKAIKVESNSKLEIYNGKARSVSVEQGNLDRATRTHVNKEQSSNVEQGNLDRATKTHVNKEQSSNVEQGNLDRATRTHVNKGQSSNVEQGSSDRGAKTYSKTINR